MSPYMKYLPFIADENVVKSESLLTHVQNPETVFTFFTQFYPIEPSYWTD